jgi:hypothetical protein
MEKERQAGGGRPKTENSLQVPRRDSSIKEAMGRAGSAGSGGRDRDRGPEVQTGGEGSWGGGAGPSAARAEERKSREILEPTPSSRQGFR